VGGWVRWGWCRCRLCGLLSPSPVTVIKVGTTPEPIPILTTMVESRQSLPGQAIRYFYIGRLRHSALFSFAPPHSQRLRCRRRCIHTPPPHTLPSASNSASNSAVISSSPPPSTDVSPTDRAIFALGIGPEIALPLLLIVCVVGGRKVWRRGGLGERVGKGDGGERWGEWGGTGIRRGRGRTARGGLGLCGRTLVLCKLFLVKFSSKRKLFQKPKNHYRQKLWLDR